MHRLLACLTLGGLYMLAASEPVPAVDHASKKAPCNESSVPSYPVSTLSPVGSSIGITADPIGVSSSSVIANASSYTATALSSSSVESLSVYPPIFVNSTISVPASSGISSSSVPTLVSTSANISSTTKGNALPTYTWVFPSVTAPISTGPIDPGDTSGSTAAPIVTGVSSGSLLSSYNTISVPIYTNTSTTESTSIYVYGNPFTNTDGISALPTSTSELTTTLTIKSTRSLTSTISSLNGSSVDPTIATQSSNSAYSATGISIGTGTLGGIIANSTSTIGVYPPFHGPFTASSYPSPSPSSAHGTGTGTSPASGVPSFYPPIVTGASGTGTLSPVTASIYSPYLTSTSVNTTSSLETASTALALTYPHSFGTTVTSSSNQSATLPPYPISSNDTTTAGPTAITSSIGGSATGLPPYTYHPTGITISDPSITTSSTNESATTLPPYPTLSNSTSTAGPTATASSIVGSATGLPSYTYTWSGTSDADPNITTSSTDESATVIPPYPTPSNSTTTAGPTASSLVYPTSSAYGTTGLSGTETSSIPIDTTCTETLTTTLADGSTSLLPTTFVTTTSPPVYPTASLNSTTVKDPDTGSSSSVGTVSLLTTGPVTTITDEFPVYSPLVPYPVVTPSVPVEYYYHHRRPHNDRKSWQSWYPNKEQEDETAEGHGYDDGEEYDYGDDEEYEYK